MHAGAQDRVPAVDAADRRTAGAGLALVARRGRIVEIKAARALQEIATGRGHVAQLLRGAGEDGAREQWIACLDLRVIGEIAIGDQRADPQTAVFRLFDLGNPKQEPEHPNPWSVPCRLDFRELEKNRLPVPEDPRAGFGTHQKWR